MSNSGIQKFFQGKLYGRGIFLPATVRNPDGVSAVPAVAGAGASAVSDSGGRGVDATGHNRPPAHQIGTTGDKFRLVGKQFCITVPHCNADLKVLLGTIHGWKPLKRGVAAREKHADGSSHLHLALWFDSRIDVRGTTSFDRFWGKHANYYKPDQTRGGWPGWCRYCCKDEDWIATFDPEALLRAKANKSAYSFEEAANALRRGQSLNELNGLMPGFVLHHLPKLRAYEAFLREVLYPNYRTSGWKIECIALWGDAGVGKSSWARGKAIEDWGPPPDGIEWTWALPLQNSTL